MHRIEYYSIGVNLSNWGTTKEAKLFRHAFQLWIGVFGQWTVVAIAKFVHFSKDFVYNFSIMMRGRCQVFVLFGEVVAPYMVVAFRTW